MKKRRLFWGRRLLVIAATLSGTFSMGFADELAATPGCTSEGSGQAPSPMVAIDVTEEIDAPPGKVWHFVGDFSGVMRWNPLVSACETQFVDGRLYRTAHFNGWWLKERLDARDTRHYRLKYAVVASSRPEVVGSKPTISLVPAGPGRTQLTWSAQAPACLSSALADYYRQRIGHLRAALTANQSGRSRECVASKAE